MSKFHINKHGVPAPCKAQKGNCPLGSDNEHYDTKEAAQEYADTKNAEQHGIVPEVITKARTRESFRLELELENGDIEGVEKQMVYHKAEDVSGAYNVIQDMRDSDGSIDKSFNSLKQERRELNSQLSESKKRIEEDIYENQETGRRMKISEETISELEEQKKTDRSRELNSKLRSEKELYNSHIRIRDMEADAAHTHDPESKEIREKLEVVNNKHKIAEYADKHENPDVDPNYPNRGKSEKTPIEQYYEERKTADEKIESKIGENNVALNTGQMKYGSNRIDADLRVDKDGKVDNLYLESENSKGDVKKVVKIHEEGDLELDDGNRVTLAHTTNWKMQRQGSPPQTHKLYVSGTKGAKGNEYDGPRDIEMVNRDSSD